MQVNGCGRVTLGGGTPVGRETSLPIDSPVRTRKASPEELAELDAALKKKYGEKKPAPKKAKANAVDAEAAKMRKREVFTEAERERIRTLCRIPRERWERMRAVMIAGAVNGWEEA